jgi:hypothetical protein
MVLVVLLVLCDWDTLLGDRDLLLGDWLDDPEAARLP